MLAARSSNSGGLWHWVAEGYPSIHWFSTDDIPIISLSYPHHPPCGKNNGVCDTPDLSGVTWSTPSTPSEMWWWFFFRPFGPGWNLAQFFFSGMDYGKMAAKEITKLVFKTRMSLRFMVVIRSYKLYFMGFIWVYKPAYIWEPHLLVVEPRWGTFPGRFLRATSLEWCEDDANFRRNLGSYPGCHWIGLRENIQETMVFFTMKYGGFLYFFPLNKSNEDDFLIFFMQDVQWLVPSCFGMMTGDE